MARLEIRAGSFKMEKSGLRPGLILTNELKYEVSYLKCLNMELVKVLKEVGEIMFFHILGIFSCSFTYKKIYARLRKDTWFLILSF
jgi:hypothetical protein